MRCAYHIHTMHTRYLEINHAALPELGVHHSCRIISCSHFTRARTMVDVQGVVANHAFPVDVAVILIFANTRRQRAV